MSVSTYDLLNKDWKELESLKNALIQERNEDAARTVQCAMDKIEDVMELYFVSEFLGSFVANDGQTIDSVEEI